MGQKTATSTQVGRYRSNADTHGAATSTMTCRGAGASFDHGARNLITFLEQLWFGRRQRKCRHAKSLTNRKKRRPSERELSLFYSSSRSFHCQHLDDDDESHQHSDATTTIRQPLTVVKMWCLWTEIEQRFRWRPFVPTLQQYDEMKNT